MQDIRQCHKCSLGRNVTNIVNNRTVGDDPQIMIVGEAPGAEEDKIGLPFQGKSGEILDKIIAKSNVSVFITNCVRCRPPDNRDPSVEEIKACRPYLDSDIVEMKPKAIVTTGRVPLRNLLPQATKQTMAYWINKAPINLHNVDTDVIPIYPVYHPAYILRNQSKMADYIEETANLLQLISAGH